MHKRTGLLKLLMTITLGGLPAGGLADVYVYQIPGGARIVTDHPLNNRDYRLVRHSRDARGAGVLVSSRRIQYAVTDPTAFDRLIHRTASRYEVDAALVKAVMHVESAFNPHAVSHKGAQGLMQVMPGTGQRYGAADLFNPVENVSAGVRYLRDLQKMFKNNTRLVLAAYNAGENAVLRHKGVPPYDETRDYVVKVMKMHRVYLAEQQAAARAAAAKRARAAPPVPAASPEPPASPATAEGASRFVPVVAAQPVAPPPPEKQL